MSCVTLVTSTIDAYSGPQQVPSPNVKFQEFCTYAPLCGVCETAEREGLRSMSTSTPRLPSFPPSVSGNVAAVAQIKRLCERHNADPAFRRQVAIDVRRADIPAGVELDIEEVRGAWDPEWRAAHRDIPLTPLAQAYRDWAAWRDGLREWFRDRSVPRDRRFAAWRERHMQRADGQLHGGTGRRLNHAPFAFELSKGCSVACSFCALSAGKLTDVFRYTDDNAALWRELLSVAADICGPAAQYAFCYWATDPFDNPDYEKFCLDFETNTDLFPTTTTALALKDPQRTRTFLRLADEHDCPMVRFSVHTSSAMKKIHATFTPEELLSVQCLAMNPESLIVKTNAGRFRDQGRADRSVIDREETKLREVTRLAACDLDPALQPMDALPETSACLTGFLVNMVDRRIKLVSPCPAGERWPFGHMVFGERRFEGQRDLGRVIEEMISTYMPERLDAERPVRFRADIRCEMTAEGFELIAASRKLRLEDGAAADSLRHIAAEIGRGVLTRDALALTTYYSTGVPVEVTLSTLDQMFSLGVLDEEPSPEMSQ